MNNELWMQLQHLMKALTEDFYHPLGEILLSGFKAEGELSLRDAADKKRVSIPTGTVWGQPGEYAWMFGAFRIPAGAAGERIVMDLNPGGEATLFVNGKPFGTRRAEWVKQPHHYIVDQTVCMKAEGGETIELAMEVYGGTPLPAYAGRPVFPETGVRFENNQPAVAGQSTFGFWNEEAYQLWLDLDMLCGIYSFLDQNDVMKEKIGIYMDRMMNALDVEVPLPERRKACTEARQILRPLMEAHNASFAPSMAVIGNSHLDLAWLWPMDETRRKTARTFAAQLRLLKEYPEAMFLQSQCAEYELCRLYYPDLFEEIREAIRGGQWIAEGGMWVEPDTNMSGGEALIRQFLYGKRYFREVLGVESRVAWLPDTFGYSAALPQIIRKFNMEGLTTQKIFWSYNDSELFPHHAFRWKGMDGSEIPCYLHMSYETKVDAATVHQRWVSRIDRDGSGDFFLPFGYGDGGGGPNRDDLEQIRRQKDLQSLPRMYYMSPTDYLVKRNSEELPVYRGELYFPCHRGTYTTQGAVKRLNRRAEEALRSWEMLAAYAAFTHRAAYPAAEIEKAWKLLLTNQFHDILPGSSIGPVYERARTQLTEVIETAHAGAAAAMSAFRVSADGETLFNPASHNALYTIGNQPLKITPLSACKQEENRSESDIAAEALRTGTGYILRNRNMTVCLTDSGEITSIVTTDGVRRVREPSNRFRLFRDLPRLFDAWDIDIQTENRETAFERTCHSEICTASGPAASIRFITRLSGSVIEQTVSLNRDAFRIDFDTRVDWQETHRLLKVVFDTGIDADEARHQIQFGFIDRPAHRSRRYDADRFEVCNHGYTALYDATHGAALLNNCKYGVGVQDGIISLSLLRAPTYPDPSADRCKHHFTYSYYVWNGSFESSRILEETEAINISPLRAEGTCDIPPLLQSSSSAVTVESVKLAEDGSGDMILRLYESMKGLRTTVLTFPFAIGSARLCDMEERPLESVTCHDNSLELTFEPFEIKTLRIRQNLPEKP